MFANVNVAFSMTNSDGNKNCHHLQFAGLLEDTLETIACLYSNISIGSERNRIYGTKYPQTQIMSQLICPIWCGDLQGVVAVVVLVLYCGTVVPWYCTTTMSVSTETHLHPTICIYLQRIYALLCILMLSNYIYVYCDLFSDSDNIKT